MTSFEEVLPGGIANQGAVVKVGDTVRRPPGPWSASVRALLLHLEDVGFKGVPRYLGSDESGRDVLTYLPGDVPLPPFPAWSMTDHVLGELARLLADFHDALESFPHDTCGPWSEELVDPLGGPVLCHNDVCPENVIFQNGRPVGLVDFDFVAPGRREWDVMRTIGMWAPIGAPERRPNHPLGLDAVARYGHFLRAYGIEPHRGTEMMELLALSMECGYRFVHRRLEQGEWPFIEMWETNGGAAREARNRAWFQEHRLAFAEVLSAPN
jgi:hypothetical protein